MFSAFDLLHSFITHVNSDNIARTTMQIWIVSWLWFCRRPWRLEVNIRTNSVHFRKSNTCAHKLDVQETDISLAQLNRSWTYFSGCRFTHGRNSRAWSLGLSNWSISFSTKPNQQIHRSGVTGKPVGNSSVKHAKTDSNHAHQSRSDQYPQFTIRKLSSRSPGRSTDENMTILWMIWTWIWLFGAYFWMPLFERQFILDKTMRRIYDTWRIIFGTVWDSYSMKVENWSVNKRDHWCKHK